MKKFFLIALFTIPTLLAFSQQTDTLVCEECIKECITKSPNQWYFNYCFYKNNQNLFLNGKKKLIFADKNYRTKIYEAQAIDSGFYQCHYYLNGQKALESLYHDSQQLTEDNLIKQTTFDYNGDTVSSKGNKMYNYKGKRIKAYCNEQLLLHRNFFQDSVDFAFEEQYYNNEISPANLIKIMLSKKADSNPHRSTFYMNKNDRNIQAEILKLDSLSTYKNCTTLYIFLDSEYNQDSILQDKLKQLSLLPKLKQICLYGNFTHVPEEIYLCRQLEVLELISYRIKSVSPELKKLVNLRSFVFIGSKDFDYKSAFNYMSKLHQLNSIIIQYNLNKPLPKELAKFKQLKVLDLGSEPSTFSGAEFTDFTETQKKNLDFLCKLKQVKYLAAMYTSDKQVDYIAKLICEKKLNYLRLYPSLYKEVVDYGPMQ
jgi:hypothetical protein